MGSAEGWGALECGEAQEAGEVAPGGRGHGCLLGAWVMD